MLTWSWLFFYFFNVGWSLICFQDNHIVDKLHLLDAVLFLPICANAEWISSATIWMIYTGEHRRQLRPRIDSIDGKTHRKYIYLHPSQQICIKHQRLNQNFHFLTAATILPRTWWRESPDVQFPRTRPFSHSLLERWQQFQKYNFLTHDREQ